MIALIGASGVTAAIWAGREIDGSLTALFVLGGIGGMVLGRLMARQLAGATLQTLFAGAMAIIAVFMLASRLIR